MPAETLRFEEMIRTLSLDYPRSTRLAVRLQHTSSRPHADDRPHLQGQGVSAMPLRLWLVILSFTVAMVAAPSTLAQTSSVDRPAELLAGTCGSLGEVVVPLANLVITSGDLQGQTSATPVEQSGTVVQFAIADFLASNHVVVVRESPAVSTVVACGDIGGALNPDGTLAVGMQAMNGSGLSGVAYFTPIDTFSNTLVTVLLVGGSGPETVSAGDATGAGTDVNTATDAATISN
jgi:hypothetical protein